MANNIIERIWNQNAVVTIEDLSGSAFQAEASAHTFVISGVDNAGAEVPLSGTVAGVFMKPDNTDVALTGSISNGKASVTLTAECYTVPGRFGLTIFVTSGSVKTAVYAAVGTVSRTNTGNVSASAEADVVDLINRINAAVATVPASWSGLMADIAPTYSASAVYPAGAYVYYNGDLYRSTTAITSAESWTAAHWTAAVLGDDVSSLKSALTAYWDADGTKNLLKNTLNNGTPGGITYTHNADGSVTINGTSTAVSTRNIGTITLKAGVKYILSGSVANVAIQVNNTGNTETYFTAGNGNDAEYTPQTDIDCNVRFRIASGKTISNEKAYPMIRYAVIEDGDFELYSKKNKELSEQTDLLISEVDILQDETEALTDNLASYENMMGAKNLLKNVMNSGTNVGLTITVNEDGTIKVNGTSTGALTRRVGTVFLKAGQKYIVSGSPSSNLLVQLDNEADTETYAQSANGSEGEYTPDRDELCLVRIKTYGSGKTFNNEIVEPMIRLGEIQDSTYVPYAMTNHELTNEIAKAMGDIAVWIGDSYVQANSLSAAGLDQTKRFSTLVSQYFGLKEKNYAVGGMGFITGDTPYSVQLQNAISDTSYDHNRVTHVFISGGINDLNTANKETLLPPAVKALVDTAYDEYANAKIYVVPLMYYNVNISQEGFWVYKTIANVCAEAKAVMIGNAYTWLNGMAGDILQDGVHPNIEGHALIASHIQNALLTGDSYSYPASCSYSPLSSKIDTGKDNYFCTVKRNGEITVNGIFTLTSNASKNERLFAYEGTGQNNPTYIGRYGKHVACFNMDTGETAVLIVSQEDITANDTVTGYRNYVQTMMAISAGTWKVLTANLNIGMQEYSGNKN